jgi:hypothetical protein
MSKPAISRNGYGCLSARLGESYFAATDTTPEAEECFWRMITQMERAHNRSQEAMVHRLQAHEGESAPVYQAPPVVRLDPEREESASFYRRERDRCVCEGGRFALCDACAREESDRFSAGGHV